MSNLGKDWLRQIIEAVREGKSPDEFFPDNFVESFGEEKFEQLTLEVIQDVWPLMGDKAWIRLGYHEALQKIDEKLYPEKYVKEEEKDYDLSEEDFFF